MAVPMTTSSSMSNRASIRRANKPLLEKRRRARINASLNQLKALVLETLQKDSARYSKLEKADILEMTVLHLKTLRHQQKAVYPHGLIGLQYGAGYRECANEIRRYFDTAAAAVDGALLARLDNHLATCIQKLNQAGLTFDPKEQLLLPPSPSYQTSILQRPGFPFPGDLDRFPMDASPTKVLTVDDVDERNNGGKDGTDRGLSRLLSYLGVSSGSASTLPNGSAAAPVSATLALGHMEQRQSRSSPGTDENDNYWPTASNSSTSSRNDRCFEENPVQVFTVTSERVSLAAGSETIKDLLRRSFDVVERPPPPADRAAAFTASVESVWRPW